MLRAIVAIVVLAQLGNADDGTQHCSRAKSRTARRILEEYLFPFVEDADYSLSPSCRLHPDNDMYREQDLERERVHVSLWRCGYCDKTFESEAYLDLHFDNRHGDLLNVTRQSCLADVCGALHCDYVDAMHTHKFSKKRCNPNAERNRLLCESLASECFPPKESTATLRLNDFFKRQFCDSHTCKSTRVYFPRGKGASNRGLYYAVCFFVTLLVLIFYAGLYLYRRDTNLSMNKLKRLSQHTGCKQHGKKQH